MSNPDSSQVEVLKSQVRAAEQQSATLRQQAEAAAAKLVVNPSREVMAERNALRDEVELLTLQLDALRQELRVAEIAGHREALASLEAEQAAEQPEVADIWAAIESGERQLLEALDRHDGLMNRTRARTRQARHHHFAGGFGDDTNQPTFYAVLPSPTKLIERLGQLPARLRRAAGQGRGGT